MNTLIRLEEATDREAIFLLTKRAFAPMPFAAGDEQELVNALRDAGVLSLSLVAEQDGQIIGHLALSPATHIGGGNGWFGLGPISVEPAHQRKGLGGALIAEAITWLRARGASGVILTGDPNYYARQGFRSAPAHAPEDEPAEYFMVLPLAGAVPAGRFGFHPAFSG